MVKPGTPHWPCLIQELVFALNFAIRLLIGEKACFELNIIFVFTMTGVPGLLGYFVSPEVQELLFHKMPRTQK